MQSWLNWSIKSTVSIFLVCVCAQIIGANIMAPFEREPWRKSTARPDLLFTRRRGGPHKQVHLRPSRLIFVFPSARRRVRGGEGGKDVSTRLPYARFRQMKSFAVYCNRHICISCQCKKRFMFFFDSLRRDQKLLKAALFIIVSIYRIGSTGLNWCADLQTHMWWCCNNT